MKASSQKQNTGSLEKEYLSYIKKVSNEDLRDMLAILYSEPELAIYNNDYEKLSKDELEKYHSDRAKMTYFDQDRLITLRGKLVDEFHIFEKIEIPDPVWEEAPDEFKTALQETTHTFPKASLLIALIKTTLNLRETGKELADELTIKQIECFTSDKSDKDYWIVINGDVSNPLKVSKNIKIWGMFFDLVSNGYMDRNNETQDLYDYLNYHPNNKIRTNTKYPKQEIIELFDNSLKPKFKAFVQTEKALVQRQNKLKSST